MEVNHLLKRCCRLIERNSVQLEWVSSAPGWPEPFLWVCGEAEQTGGEIMWRTAHLTEGRNQGGEEAEDKTHLSSPASQ